MIVFDIETGPLDFETLKARAKPFERPREPAPFNPDDVKTGNIKDPAKKQEKIDAAKMKHEAEVKSFSATVKKAEADWWQEIVEKAPLDARTGRVLAVGYFNPAKKKLLVDDAESNERSEAGLLEQFWRQYQTCRKANVRLVGHNVFGFDLPFLYQRSMILGVDVPDEFLERGRYVDANTFACTMQLWSCGRRDYIGLDELADAMGFEGKAAGEFEVAGKPLELCGKNFWRFFHDTEENRLRALGYLRADLVATADVAERLGLE